MQWCQRTDARGDEILGGHGGEEGTVTAEIEIAAFPFFSMGED